MTITDTQTSARDRRTRAFSQPESTAALRPSQRRAAIYRTARREQVSAADWLRRLAHLSARGRR